MPYPPVLCKVDYQQAHTDAESGVPGAREALETARTVLKNVPIGDNAAAEAALKAALLAATSATFPPSLPPPPPRPGYCNPLGSNNPVGSVVGRGQCSPSLSLRGPSPVPYGSAG
jgi:hypothetical protein